MNRPHAASASSKSSRPMSRLMRERWRRESIDGVRQRLRKMHWLRLHVFLIGLIWLAALMVGGACLRAIGIESLAWRYAVLLPAGYLVYLAVLRLWAGTLLRRDADPSGDALDAVDVADFMASSASHAGRPGRAVPFQSGGGGDFGGGGASGDFSGGPALADGVSLSDVAETAEVTGKTLGAAGDALGSMDEGAVVAVPLLVIVGIAMALSAGVFALFGVEVLLAVAVEVALAGVAGGMAWRRLSEEGWWRCAIRHTWAGALGLFVVGVLLGAAIDHWIPAADSLPHAWHLIRIK
ncbi:hypothetical protein [Roseateles amylovorans]|uniref:Transmembrane protein n=1 Tax=Roseateles amylovorans TaxID=2978473 RepID=A0ABY6B1R8_9BURK|nr:hypothetical protein [Roseateles amylovorans]UXH78654.1 hypothetical protein N4261_01560 [Roseateles amylovorans]